MRFTIVVILTFFASFSLLGQVSFKKQTVKSLSHALIDPMELGEDYDPVFIFSEAPKPYRTEIERAKEESAKRFPRREVSRVQARSMVDVPEIDYGFLANRSGGSFPPDNSLGIGANGMNISAINSRVRFSDVDGNFLRDFSLSQFANRLGGGRGHFDPRIIYDPEADKFCAVWLAGFSSTESVIIVAFSTSGDITEPWSTYELSGNPFQTNEWTDYPMISLTKDKLMLTVNLIRDDEPWETGFAQTLIYAMDKQEGYNGSDELVLDMYSDVSFGGRAIRNLHPVKSADETLAEDQIFVSNRNFDVSNDTIFYVRLSENAATNDDVEIDFLLADVPYGLPPNCVQPGAGLLNTNDGRILDAIRLNDRIQFVSNSIDMETGRAAIYHGFIDDLNGDKNLTARFIPHPVGEVAYPGMAWTGIGEDEDDVIIVAEYTSEVDFPGYSCLYMNEEREYSAWLPIKSGENNLANQQGPTERWGDYIGCQRQYDLPGAVWASSMYTTLNSRMETYVVRISEPNRVMSSTEDAVPELADLSVYPNPTVDRFTVEIDIPKREQLHIALYNMQGELVELFLKDKAKKQGRLKFSFDPTPLVTGNYMLKVHLGNTEVLAKKVVKI